MKLGGAGGDGAHDQPKILAMCRIIAVTMGFIEGFSASERPLVDRKTCIGGAVRHIERFTVAGTVCLNPAVMGDKPLGRGSGARECCRAVTFLAGCAARGFRLCLHSGRANALRHNASEFWGIIFRVSSGPTAADSMATLFAFTSMLVEFGG